MTTIRDVNPDTVGDELHGHAQALVARIDCRALVSTGDLSQAVVDRELLGAQIKRVEAFFAPLKRMAHELHKAICDRENAILVPLKAVDRARASAISEYKAVADRAREERERVLAEDRRRDADARAASEAADLEARGQNALAAAVLAEAIAAPLPSVALRDETKDVEGLKFRRAWRWRFAGGPTDVSATHATIIARAFAIIPREYLSIDERKISAYARAMKSAGKIPGIEIYCVDEPIR